jgi:hypothetical protein
MGQPGYLHYITIKLSDCLNSIEVRQGNVYIVPLELVTCSVINRTHHCKWLERCVRKMDHYCP